MSSYDWTMNGEFHAYTSKLSSHSLVDCLNTALLEQYIEKTNSITFTFESITSGEIQINNISIVFRILNLNGDTIGNANDYGVKFKNTYACMASLSFNIISSPMIKLENGNISSVGCNLQPTDVDIDSTSIIYMRNYLKIKFSDRAGSVIDDGILLIKEESNQTVFNGTIDSDYIVIQARYATKDTASTTIYTPHNLTANKCNITQYQNTDLNQNQIVTFEFPRLDLHIQNCTISNEFPELNECIFINTTILNDGYENAASNITIRYYLNTTLSETILGEYLINGMTAWATSEILNVITMVCTTGYQYIVVKIDDDDNITEDVENNNVSYHQILVCDESLDDWNVETPTSYDNKVIRATNLTLSSSLNYTNGILEVSGGSITIPQDHQLNITNSTLVVNHLNTSGQMSINDTFIQVNGDFIMNTTGILNVNDTIIQMDNVYDNESGMLFENNSVFNLNGVNIYSKRPNTYYILKFLGNGVISNATLANLYDGLEIESGTVQLNNTYIHHSNKNGLRVENSTLMIYNSSVMNCLEKEISLFNSTVMMIDCYFNQSKIELTNSLLCATGSMKIRVVNDVYENESNAEVIIKNAYQELIFSGLTDNNGIVYLNSTILQFDKIGTQNVKICKNPYTVVVKKDNLSNITKIMNDGPDVGCEETIIMLRNDCEYNNVWIKETRLKVPDNIEGAFSSEPFSDGMTFCAHIFHSNSNPIQIDLYSNNTTTNQPDNNDIFYDAKIYNELGDIIQISTSSGLGAIEIISESTPVGHYDVTWKYYNDNNGSEMVVEGRQEKIIYSSLDYSNINLINVTYPKIGEYLTNISFNTDEQRDIFIYGYSEAVDENHEDQSHISNLFGLNGSEIETITANGNNIYSDSLFEYYLGNNEFQQSTEFSFSISTSNENEWSNTIWKVGLKDTGSYYNTGRDLNHDGINDYDESYYAEGTASGRDDDRTPSIVSYDGPSDLKTSMYDCWDGSPKIAYPKNGAVIRRGTRTNNGDTVLNTIFDIHINTDYPSNAIRIVAEYYDPRTVSDYDPYHVRWAESGSFIDYTGITCTKTDEYDWSVTVDKDTSVGLRWICFYYSTSVDSQGFDEIYGYANENTGNSYIASKKIGYKWITYIEVIPICIIYELPKYTDNADDRIGLSADGQKCYNYNDAGGSIENTRTMYAYKWILENGIYKFKVEEHDSVNGKPAYNGYLTSQYTHIVWWAAGHVALGDNSDSSVLNVQSFLKYIMNYDGTKYLADRDTAIILNNYHGVGIPIKDSVYTHALYGPTTIDDWHLLTCECEDFASVACGLLRAVGIPARTCIGLFPSSDWKYHVWVEFWGRLGTGDYRWITYDPSGAAYSNDPIKVERSNYKYGYPDSEVIFSYSGKWTLDKEKIQTDANGSYDSTKDKAEENASPADNDIIELHSYY